MSKEIEVIKVKHKDGFMIINKSDFDKDKHEEFKETNKNSEGLNKDEVKESKEEDKQVVKKVVKRIAKK